jgi:amino acid transporter
LLNRPFPILYRLRSLNYTMQESMAVVVLVFLVLTGLTIWHRKRYSTFPIGQPLKALPFALWKALPIALIAGMLLFLWTFSAQSFYRMVLFLAAVVVLVFLLVTGLNIWHRKRSPMSPARQRFKALPIALIAGGIMVVWVFVGLIVLLGEK